MKKVIDRIAKIQTALGVVCLLIFISLTLYQIIARIINTNAVFTEEISNYAFIWSVFMGTPIMLRENGHFSFTGFTEKMKGKVFIFNEFIVLILLFIFSFFIAIYGTSLTIKFWNWRFSSIRSIKLGWAWISLPICGYTSILYSIENIINFIKNPESRKIERDELV